VGTVASKTNKQFTTNIIDTMQIADFNAEKLYSLYGN